MRYLFGVHSWLVQLRFPVDVFLVAVIHSCVHSRRLVTVSHQYESMSRRGVHIVALCLVTVHTVGTCEYFTCVYLRYLVGASGRKA